MSKTFAETAMELAGKSAEESKSIGKLDAADEQVENLFAKKYQTVNSPVHRIIWNPKSVELFEDFGPKSSECFNTEHRYSPFEKQKQSILDVIRKHQINSTLVNKEKEKDGVHPWLRNNNNKLSDELINDLGEAGYWGLLVDLPGKPAMPLSEFAPFLADVAALEPVVAGLASVHQCIGLVDPIKTFGNQSQKSKYLPDLASGKRLSGFALTEPNAGSDLTAIRTKAVLDGDYYIVTGEKVFITNATYGRSIALVCMIDNKPAVLIADLPEKDNETFEIYRYGLYALKNLHNVGLKFKGFKVPKENLIVPSKGDGLTIAYHGLNLGRVSLCANASGTMRKMMASILPWANYRITYGQPIENRELVQYRLARLAGFICGADALVEWCSRLLDNGYRGEMECIIAKIFGSEAQKEAAVDILMKIHGGRSFLHGHLLGDNIHEFLAPCIYEGEGSMLGMAFFKSIVKDHGMTYMEPIGKRMAKLKVRGTPNPYRVLTNLDVFGPYAMWMASQLFGGSPRCNVKISKDMRPFVNFATNRLGDSATLLSGMMRKYQLKLADRQVAMSNVSQNIQDTITLLVTALWAQKHQNSLKGRAALVLCNELKSKITGKPVNGRAIKQAVLLGETLIKNAHFNCFTQGLTPENILLSYSK